MKRLFWTSVRIALAAWAAAGCHDRGLFTTAAAEPNALSLTSSNDTWSEAVNLGAPINSPGVDQSPTLSTDGLSLYFASDRPGGLGAVDLWVSHRATPDSPWETPVNLGAAMNSADIESGPNLSIDGHLLFFQSSRPGGEGSNDIYVSYRADAHDDLGWGDPVNVGPGVNSSAGEFGPWYSEDGADGPVLYFARGPNNTFTQLYVAPVTRDGLARGPATPITELNDPTVSQGHPTLSVNGREMVFYSNRTGGLGGNDLWIATRRSANDSWSSPVNLGAPINSSTGELLPALSRDGRTLLLTTNNRPGGLGGMDIWMSTRLPPGLVP
jgi:Tol biopolymer transport system component